MSYETYKKARAADHSKAVDTFLTWFFEENAEALDEMSPSDIICLDIEFDEDYKPTFCDGWAGGWAFQMELPDGLIKAKLRERIIEYIPEHMDLEHENRTEN